MKDCLIVQDLLPLYVEGLVSKESKELIEEHIAICEKCRAVLARMQADHMQDNMYKQFGNPTKEQTERKEFQKALRRHKKKNNRTTLLFALLAIVLSTSLCLGLLWYKGFFHIIERQTSPNGATTTTVYDCDFLRYGRLPQSGGFTLVDKGYFNGQTTYSNAQFLGLWWSVDSHYQVVSMLTEEGIWLSLTDYTRNIGTNLDGRLNMALYEQDFFQDVIYDDETGQRLIEFQFIQWSLKDESMMLIYFSYIDANQQFHEGYFWYDYETGELSGEMELEQVEKESSPINELLTP